MRQKSSSDESEKTHYIVFLSHMQTKTFGQPTRRIRRGRGRQEGRE